MMKSNHIIATYVKRLLVKKKILKGIFKWFMKTRRNTNVICVNIHHSYTLIWENTLRLLMKTWGNISATFATRVLAVKEILRDMFKLFIKTRRNTNVMCVNFLLSSTVISGSTLSIFIKKSNNINATFVAKAFVKNKLLINMLFRCIIIKQYQKNLQWKQLNVIT